MKKIFVVIACAGMSIGLIIGGVGNTGTKNSSNVSATHSPKTAIACSITPCSMDEVITNRIFSLSFNELQNNYKYKNLQAELDSLKAELSTMKEGTAEYNEKISEIHNIWSKISVLIGEINSQIVTETGKLLEVSQDNINKIKTDYEFKDILYIAETE